MLFREIITVYSDIYTEHVNTLCGHNVESVPSDTWRNMALRIEVKQASNFLSNTSPTKHSLSRLHAVIYF
jgi:hypothetical protein